MKNLNNENKRIIMVVLILVLIILMYLFISNNLDNKEGKENIGVSKLICSHEEFENSTDDEYIKQQINLEGDEIDKYNLIDVKYLGNEVVTLDNEEAIQFKFIYKNKSDKAIKIRPKIYIASKIGTIVNYYDDEQIKRETDNLEVFLREKDIALEEFKNGYDDIYSKDFLEYTKVNLKPNEEVEITFTQKKSTILDGVFSKRKYEELIKMNIKDIMGLEHMRLEYGYKYKLEKTDEDFNFYYVKYPNTKLNVKAYIDYYIIKRVVI